MFKNLSRPELLGDHHKRKQFDCGNQYLNQWLWNKADKNQKSNASRCFVTCNKDNEIIGFYCLSAGSVIRSDAPKNLQRNMPDPIPVLVMGRLAVDENYHGQGIGKALLRDAILRTLNTSEEIGIVALLVHAISVEAKNFYLSYGFIESPIHPMTLLLTCKTARQALDEG